MLDELRTTVAWALMEQRLISLRDRYMQLLITGKHDMAPTEIQRILGYMRGLNDVLLEPHKLEAEWKRAVEAENKKTEARAQV